jgi:hypothetical protein
MIRCGFEESCKWARKERTAGCLHRQANVSLFWMSHAPFKLNLKYGFIPESLWYVPLCGGNCIIIQNSKEVRHGKKLTSPSFLRSVVCIVQVHKDEEGPAAPARFSETVLNCRKQRVCFHTAKVSVFRTRCDVWLLRVCVYEVRRDLSFLSWFGNGVLWRLSRTSESPFASSHIL